jgi:hypothetical protein
MTTNQYWATAEEAFRKGDFSWLPCPAEFYTDMLEVVPPAIMEFHPAFGCYFANGEAWTHTANGAVYLFFKEKPQPACRMATLQEFIAEVAAIPLPGWQQVTEQEVNHALKMAGPSNYEQYQSNEYRLSFQGSALKAVYTQGVRIPGKGWFRPAEETSAQLSS